jgi:flagellar L-ring protein precursor FlgH
MRHSVPAGTVLLIVLIGAASGADSIWARREPHNAFLFEDLRARRVGDLLTIVIQENTTVNENEKRDLSKSTSFADKINVTANAALGKNLTRSGSGAYDGAGSSTRTFDGSAAFISGRVFTDTVTATVIDILPNGNLVVEGCRTRMVSGELRTLRITGVVRPADIDAGNSVGSQVVGNFQILYAGRGTETAVTRPSIFKRLLFGVWPN